MISSINKSRMSFLCWSAAAALVVCLANCTAREAVGNVVSYDGDRAVRVDGVPFFPVGVYNAFSSTSTYPNCPTFAELAANGINTVHSYAWEGDGYYYGDAWLDAAEDNGLMALVGMRRQSVQRMYNNFSIDRVNFYKDHPATLGWHVMDEPNWTGAPWGYPGSEYIPNIYDIIKQNDVNHPVTLVTVNHTQIHQFMPYVDVMQTDYYNIPPIPQGSYFGTGFYGVKRWVQEARAASGGTKPFWFVAQAWDIGTDKANEGLSIPLEWQRFPTEQELRITTYTAIAAGARGILYYSLNLMMDEANTRPGDHVEHRQRLYNVTNELQQLQPLLTADTVETIVDNEAVNVISMLKSDGENLYLIVANYERSATSTTIIIPDHWAGKARLVFGEGENPIINDQLELNLGAIESRVYLITPFLYGDANSDDVVSADDYASVQAHFGETGEPMMQGDASGNGMVSADDYAYVQSHFGETIGMGGLGGVPVPEPGTLVLLGAGLVTLLYHRRN